jgi:hypothetical protein
MAVESINSGMCFSSMSSLWVSNVQMTDEGKTYFFAYQNYICMHMYIHVCVCVHMCTCLQIGRQKSKQSILLLGYRKIETDLMFSEEIFIKYDGSFSCLFLHCLVLEVAKLNFTNL